MRSRVGCSGASVTVRSRATSSGSPRGTYSVMASSCARVAVRSTSNFLSTYPSFCRRARSFSRRASRFASEARSASLRSGDGGLPGPSGSRSVRDGTANASADAGATAWFPSFALRTELSTRFSARSSSGGRSSSSSREPSPSAPGLAVSPVASRAASSAASDRPTGRHASQPSVFVTVFAAHAQVLFTTHKRASHRRRSASEAVENLVSTSSVSFFSPFSSWSSESSASSLSGPGPASRSARIRNRSGSSSIGPGVSGCHRVSGARTPEDE
mmetsp:Transcript_2452/g.10212  ORF Transcript_2452/g.10212 Transcript_2452/m.10212 type:complete len:272 (-) Transcript_2452:1777-2592(-)